MAVKSTASKFKEDHLVEMSAQYSKHPFLLTVQDVVDTLNTDMDKGLSSVQVAQLRQQYPPNELDIGGAIPWYTIFIKQLCNAMILVRYPLASPPCETTD